MRLAPRLAAGITLLALIAAGCGSSNVAYREVPGGPAKLDVPGKAENFGAAATPTATAENGDTEGADAQTAESTPEADTGTGGTTNNDGAATDGTVEGGTEAPAETGTDTTQTPPAEGTGNPDLEDYCAQNPGAC